MCCGCGGGWLHAHVRDAGTRREALITGRKLHGTILPSQLSNLARRLFPAQVLKSACRRQWPTVSRYTQLARDDPSDARKPQ